MYDTNRRAKAPTGRFPCKMLCFEPSALLHWEHSGPGTEGELLQPTSSAEPRRVLPILFRTPSCSETYSSEQSQCMPTSSKICVCSNKSIHDINGKRSYHRISRNIKMKNYLIKHVTLTESPVSANGGQHVQGSRLRWPDMTPSVPSYTSPTDWA